MPAEILSMRKINVSSKLIFVLATAFYAGCSNTVSTSSSESAKTDPAIYARYGPERIDVLPITSIVVTPASTHDYTINAYVGLLDAFGTQIKAPASFRFELFEQVQRSAEPKGKRLALWPDINLTDPVVNNNHWQDFLRAYLFSLPVQQPITGTCILQVTCFCPSGKRLSAEFLIRTTH